VSGSRGNIGRSMERAPAAPSPNYAEGSLEGLPYRDWSFGLEKKTKLV
jgi:hypothetical protein